MPKSFPRYAFAVCLAASTVAPDSPAASRLPSPVLDLLRWRSIGPFRGGRAICAAGIPGNATTFYFGAVGGGVWKTTDAGHVWKPIFDAAGVASVGAIAIAPSDPRVIYVGTGESDLRSDLSIGAGMFRSADGGETWKPIGLAASRQIGRVVVDPRDANVVLVAALGHAYGPNPERGVFRSEDGGTTWRRTLFRDENTGAIDLALDPADPDVVYASLFRVRRPPWSVYPPATGPGNGVFRSADGGRTWTEITGRGFPTGLGRVGVATVRAGAATRVYAVVDAEPAERAGLYRSDDGGGSFRRVGGDARITSRGWYFGRVAADPRDADVVYVPNVSLYRSADGGRTYTAFKGAPGGDDYHFLWIDPAEPSRMIVASDQGATVTVNGGATWTSWENQPTGQFYHVVTDGQFPYRVYGSQQDSGTASVPSRSDFGQISFRDWWPVGGEESGYIAPDPRDPEIVYGGGPGGTVRRFRRTTGQSQDVSPWPKSAWGIDATRLKYRFTWTSPLLFSPKDPELLYLGAQMLLATRDGGKSWREASPDLTVHPRDSEAGRNRGVIYTIAPSPLAEERIWVGTDNGLIHVSDDGGGTWRNVTPPELSPWSKIAMLEASRHDGATAYAAVDRHRLDDVAPHAFATHDSGRTWRRITAGLPDGAFVHAVREDPVRRGLLYAATETGVFVSFDDGGRWESLQRNLPPASVRDLVVHGDDLVIATHGRGFWIADGVAPLRELDPARPPAAPHLFAPAPAWRVRWNVSNDTPLPRETPAGENPPDGARIDYFLPAEPAGEVALEILDASGRRVRRFSSADAPTPPPSPPAFPDFWLASPRPLSKKPGAHRFVWDLRFASPLVPSPGYGIDGIVGATPALPRGPLVLPGTYRVRLTVAGRDQTRELTVRMDPRVRAAPGDLEKQLELSRRIGAELARLDGLLRAVRAAAAGRDPALAREAAAVEGSEFATTPEGGGLRRVAAGLAGLVNAVDSADAAPTAQASAVFEEYRRELDALIARWKKTASSFRLPASSFQPEGVFSFQFSVFSSQF